MLHSRHFSQDQHSLPRVIRLEVCCRCPWPTTKTLCLDHFFNSDIGFADKWKPSSIPTKLVMAAHWMAQALGSSQVFQTDFHSKNTDIDRPNLKRIRDGLESLEISASNLVTMDLDTKTATTSGTSPDSGVIPYLPMKDLIWVTSKYTSSSTFTFQKTFPSSPCCLEMKQGDMTPGLESACLILTLKSLHLLVELSYLREPRLLELNHCSCSLWLPPWRC